MSNVEQSPLYVVDAERADEYQGDDAFVLRGLTQSLREQLMVKSKQEAIVRWTGKDAAERFITTDVILASESDRTYYPLVQRSADGQLDLGGLLFFSPREKHGANYTYAVRLYEGYGRRGLAERLTNTGIDDFALLHPQERSIWLETDLDNEGAHRLYEKTGFISIIRGDTREVMTKVLEAKQPKIVVIGGGTGSMTVLSGLKDYTENLTAVVNMSDDGGSSGKLRDEQGVLPPGDVRQCLIALSEHEVLREVLDHRFVGGSLDGQSMGNLLITGMEQWAGDFDTAIKYLSDILAIKGRVTPVTTTDSRLRARMKNGDVIYSEYQIGKMNFGEERPEIWLEPAAVITESAQEALQEAELVVIAPGNLYGSLAPALVVDGMREALEQTPAKVVYVANLVTKPGQTEGFKVHDFADEVERFIGAQVLDFVLFNTDEPPRTLLRKYTREGEYVLEFDLDKMDRRHYRAVGLPLVAKNPLQHKGSDKLQNDRTLIRHDGQLLAKEIIKLLGRKEN